jgi:hypothetical protein
MMLAVAAFVAAGIGYAFVGGTTLRPTSDTAKIAAVQTGSGDNDSAPMAPSVAMPAPVSAAPQVQSFQEAAPKTRGLSSVVAQSYSNKCQIPDGSICYVAAQQVGAYCECPGSGNNVISGVIIW